MQNIVNVKGYKIFDPDWKCLQKQYSCPGMFYEDVNIDLGHHGMHFCLNILNCFQFYQFSAEYHIAEVIAHGKIMQDNDKCVTDKLEIVREIPWSEVLHMVNTGSYNTGYGNTGEYDAGCWNTGDNNTGSWNTGDYNVGNDNAGCNNTGSYNTGCWNAGNGNAGNHNAGNRNTGNRNFGDWNTGSYNTGEWNTGDWNISSFNTGCFCTEKPKLKFFNKPSDWDYEDWVWSKARHILNEMPYWTTEWVREEDMTEDEKEQFTSSVITGGFLRKSQNIFERQKWWDALSKKDKEIVMSLPNFDANIFKECTGITVNI
jgi:hypothetical protein